VEEPARRAIHAEVMLHRRIRRARRRCEQQQSMSGHDLAEPVSACPLDQKVEIGFTGKSGLHVEVALPEAEAHRAPRQLVEQCDEGGDGGGGVSARPKG
jgi:hypothetical protein